MNHYLGSLGSTSVAGPVAPSNYTVKGDICLPNNATVLALWKNLQTQINRLAVVQGVAKIAVDGRIGPGTAKAYSAVTGQPLTASVNLAAAASSGMVSNLKAKADSAGAPAVVPTPPLTIASTVNAAGGVTHPNALVQQLSQGNDVVGLIKTPVGIVLCVGVAFIGYKVVKKVRGKRSSSAAPALVSNPGRRRRRRRAHRSRR